MGGSGDEFEGVAVGGAIPTLRSLALRFVLEQAAVSSAILGPRNYAQLNQLVREAGYKVVLTGEVADEVQSWRRDWIGG